MSETKDFNTLPVLAEVREEREHAQKKPTIASVRVSPGSYLAVLDRSPFWEPGVPGLMERGSFHLVLGFPQGQR